MYHDHRGRFDYPAGLRGRHALDRPAGQDPCRELSGRDRRAPADHPADAGRQRHRRPDRQRLRGGRGGVRGPVRPGRGLVRGRLRPVLFCHRRPGPLHPHQTAGLPVRLLHPALPGPRHPPDLQRHGHFQQRGPPGGAAAGGAGDLPHPGTALRPGRGPHGRHLPALYQQGRAVGLHGGVLPAERHHLPGHGGRPGGGPADHRTRDAGRGAARPVAPSVCPGRGIPVLYGRSHRSGQRGQPDRLSERHLRQNGPHGPGGATSWPASCSSPLP